MKNIILSFLLLLPASGWAGPIQVYFSPNGGCEQAVIDEIRRADRTIDIAMYFLSSGRIAHALVKAREHGVNVRIVLDQGQEIERASKSGTLISHGLEVRYHMGFGLMHNKFAIIDGETLLTGSFNWTRTAEERNEENMLILTDAPTIQQYQERFEYLWNGSRRDAREAQGAEAVPSWFCTNFHLLCGH